MFPITAFHVQSSSHTPYTPIGYEEISPLGWSIRGQQKEIETYLRNQGFTLENDTIVLLGCAIDRCWLDVKQLIEKYGCDMLGMKYTCVLWEIKEFSPCTNVGPSYCGNGVLGKAIPLSASSPVDNNPESFVCKVFLCLEMVYYFSAGNCDSDDYLSPLGKAISNRFKEIETYLRERGCTFCDDGTESKLCAAARAGDLDLVKELEEKICELRHCDLADMGKNNCYGIMIQSK